MSELLTTLLTILAALWLLAILFFSVLFVVAVIQRVKFNKEMDEWAKDARERLKNDNNNAD